MSPTRDRPGDVISIGGNPISNASCQFPVDGPVHFEKSNGATEVWPLAETLFETQGIKVGLSNRGVPMAQDQVLTGDELEEVLGRLPGWEIRDGWLRRTFKTPGWPHTIMLITTIGYLAEAAWHHPDLSVGYAKVTVKLQTHRVRAITYSDVDLATRIQEVAIWKPAEESALEGFPKKWVQ